MFGTIRKHQTWLWAVIITLTIISFVIFFSPYSKMNDSRRVKANYGSINGEKITGEQFAEAERDVYLNFFMRNGRMPDQDAKRMGFDEMRETYQWLLLLQKERQFGINVSTDVLEQTARDMVRNFERAGVPCFAVHDRLSIGDESRSPDPSAPERQLLVRGGRGGPAPQDAHCDALDQNRRGERRQQQLAAQARARVFGWTGSAGQLAKL
jgi:hypothetical protein